MAWYDEAVFYHIYPLGMCGAPETNDYKDPVSRLTSLLPWTDHIKNIGCNAIYIGPLFESVGHGYETTDYKKLDSRLGTNEDLKSFVSVCHSKGIRVIFDGVFNHTGRDFFAFRDIRENRENSRYKGWYNINFGGNNSYNDGFSYENWGGYDLLVKLNQKNPEVVNYITDVIRFWVKEFDVDGIRLDAADVLDFEFMKALRNTANEVKPDFWLMGEVIHGDYKRWANESTLHSVTNYHLHKALYSGHNDRNYFEIAHTVKRLYDMSKTLKLYNFTDNHDVERIYTKLSEKSHYIPTHILLYTLPGVPSIYYGSEFGIEGRKERHSDKSLRPSLSYEEYKKAFCFNPPSPNLGGEKVFFVISKIAHNASNFLYNKNKAESLVFTRLISRLGEIRHQLKALSYGEYKELFLTNRQYAFSRKTEEETVIVCVNNDSCDSTVNVSAENADEFTCAFSGEKIKAINGRITLTIKASSGEILFSSRDKVPEIKPSEFSVPVREEKKAAPVITKEEKKAEKKEEKTETKPVTIPDKPYEEMTVEELQQVILDKMAKNGPVTDRMKQDVYENVYHNSLITWARSFR